MRRRFMIFNNDALRTPFYIEALEDGVYYSIPESSEYKIDDGEWIVLPLNTNSENINTGSRIYIKGRINGINATVVEFFKISGRCKIGGNIQYLGYSDNAPYTNYVKPIQYMSMFSKCVTIEDAIDVILPATTLARYCYSGMFEGCTNLKTAPELPATTLADSCYEYMFEGCTSLTTGPELLPATTLADRCYYSMFRECTSLTTAPALPATTLASNCYYSMFHDCSKLNYIKMLATNIGADYCLGGWVSGVASSGIFVKHSAMTSLPTATSTNDYVGIPSGWTVQNA